MIDLIIRFLQSAKTLQVRKLWHGLFLLLLGYFVIFMIFRKFFLELDNFMNIFSGEFEFSYLLFLIGVIVTLLLVTGLIIKGYKSNRIITNRDTWIQNIMIIIGPLFVLYGLNIEYLSENGILDAYPDRNFSVIIHLLILIYPFLILIIGPTSHSFTKYYGWYNTAFFTYIAGLGTFSIIFLSEMDLESLFQIIFLLYLVKSYYIISVQGHKLGLLKGFLILGLVGLIFGYLPLKIPGILYQFYTQQINKAVDIIKTGGENVESFTKAKKIRFLESAYLHHFNRQKNTSSGHFEKIFDTTPETYYGDKLKNISSSNTRATNASKVNENASVELGVITVDNRIVGSESNVPIMKTVYDIYFQNTTTENQEVIINFEAPNDLSVVSDLKLGLDLQFIGQIATRGAARKVYEDSLRINKDPALIEKVGISTYNLRVFPIPSKLDEKTNGRQRVQITLHSPVNNKESILYSPKFSLINARVDKNSSLVSKVFINKKLVQEDIIGSDEMDKYLHTSHILSDTITNKIPKNSIYDTCIPQLMNNGTLSLDINSIFSLVTGYQNPLDTEKTYLFMDNSSSVARNTNTSIRYPQIYNTIKNYGEFLQDVELYAYNFRVDPLSQIDGMSFWGYSNIDSVVTFIEKNNIRNSRIVIVTDDDSYNMSTREVKNRKFDTILSNQINVIKLGDNIKRYKSDFISLLGASQGNIYHVDSSESLEQTLKSVFADPRKIIPTCVGTEDANKKPTEESNLLNKIYAGYLSSRMMRSVSNDNDRTAIADKQNKLASAFRVVTQFNSMIALENEQQKRDLDRYEKQNDRFASDFNNYGSKNTSNNNRFVQDFSRPIINNDGSTKSTWKRYENNNRGPDEILDDIVDHGKSDIVKTKLDANLSSNDWLRNAFNNSDSIASDPYGADIYFGDNQYRGDSDGVGIVGAGAGQQENYSLFSGSQINIFGSLLYLWYWCILIYHRYLVLALMFINFIQFYKNKHTEEVVANSNSKLDE